MIDVFNGVLLCDFFGNRLSRVTKNRKGEVVSKENRAYDRFGCLAETTAGFGAKVTYAYDSKGRLSRQVVDGSPIDYEYTKYGQLAGKHLGGRQSADASVVYEYSKSGQIVARTANGVRQTYEYDKKGQLLAVKDSDGNAVERYAYDKAGNMLKKTVNGKTTTFTFDDANQLVSSTTDGVTTHYSYDAAGRLVKEGNKTYRYGYLDRVLSVTDGDTTRTFTYHADGQLASATVGSALRADRGATPLSDTETFLWDGLALIQRGDEQFVNEPHIGGGNPVASSKGTSYFNDALGTTVGAKKDGKYSAAVLSAFGEGTDADKAFFTGKPMVEGLGHAFLMRNYRAGLAKWQTADPMGYPNGWNALAYCGNMPQLTCDYLGCAWWNPLDWISWLFDSDDEKYIKDTKFEELSCSVLDTHHVSLVCGLGSEGKWKWTPSVTWAYNVELGLHPMGIGDLNIKVNVKSQEPLEYSIPAYKCDSKKHDFSGTLDYDLEVRFTVAKCIVTYSDGSTEEKLVGDYQIVAVNLKHKDCE